MPPLFSCGHTFRSWAINKTRWELCKLGDVASVVMGQAPPGDTVTDEERGFPFLQGNAEFGEIYPTATQRCTQPLRFAQPDDTLVSVRAPVGALNKADRLYAIGRGLAAISFRSLDPSYGYHALRLAVHQLRRVSQGTTFEAVSRKELANIEFFAPADPSEQRRIADILDALDERSAVSIKFIAKSGLQRRGIIEELIGQDFMSGEGTTIGAILTRIEGGWSPLCHDYPPAPGESGVLKVSAVTSGRYRPEESKALFTGMRARPTIEVRDGDLLICRANGIKELVGVAAMVENTPAGLMLSDKTLRLIPDLSRTSSEYLAIFLASSHARRQIEALLSGSSGQNNISQEFIRSMVISLPAIARQNQVVRAVNSLGRKIAADQAEFSKLQLLKQGLMEDLLSARMRVPCDV